MDAVNALENLFPGTGSAQAGRSENQLAQEDFLKLLVAQLENQDPSKPVENGEFLGQIAQFSMVEGIGGLEQGFDRLADSMQRNQVADAAAMLGKDVLFDANRVRLADGAGLEGRLVLDKPATAVQLKLLDGSGTTIATQGLGNFTAGSPEFRWDGTTLDGSPAAAGDYRVVVTGNVGGVEQSLPVQLYGRVGSVGVDPQTRELSLQLTDGAILGLSDIYEFK